MRHHGEMTGREIRAHGAADGAIGSSVYGASNKHARKKACVGFASGNVLTPAKTTYHPIPVLRKNADETSSARALAMSA